VQKHDVPDPTVRWVDAVMAKYGPQVCHILVQNIGGQAARSELDTLAEPLKKLVFAQRQAKKWLSDALDDPSFPSDKVGPTEKRVWLQKIMKYLILMLLVYLFY